MNAHAGRFRQIGCDCCGPVSRRAVLGGLAGLATSFALVNLIGSMSPTENAPIIQVTSLAIAFGFSVLVGIAAGIFPAIKAARLNPIQALRYE